METQDCRERKLVAEIGKERIARERERERGRQWRENKSERSIDAHETFNVQNYEQKKGQDNWRENDFQLLNANYSTKLRYRPVHATTDKI